MRRRLSRAGQGRVIALLALALFVRALVPSGWMPVATPDGIRLALCPGQVAMPATPGMHHDKEHGGPKRHEGSQSDAPCAFAGVGLAADAPPPAPAILPVAFAPAPTPPAPLPAAVGRGLAAPPPPATGPPAFA